MKRALIVAVMVLGLTGCVSNRKFQGVVVRAEKAERENTELRHGLVELAREYKKLKAVMANAGAKTREARRAEK